MAVYTSDYTMVKEFVGRYPKLGYVPGSEVAEVQEKNEGAPCTCWVTFGCREFLFLLGDVVVKKWGLQSPVTRDASLILLLQVRALGLVTGHP